jgi:energy-converting hydrogenase A subunit R
MQSVKKIFVSDCEGPISKNDNAFELTSHLIPDGDKLFANISKYDDVLAEVFRKPGYSAGSTLKLVLPFFKAYEITDKQMEEYSEKNIVLIANSKNTLHHVRTMAEAFIVSTSYEHYIRPLCKAIDFPYENTYCTKLSLGKYQITLQEREHLEELAEEIVQMPLIVIPANAKTTRDFSEADQVTIQRLDEIFWGEIPRMSTGKVLTDVMTVGGEQKAEAVRDAAKRLSARLANVMYVGDSITDVEAFKLVRDNGGLAVSFNGNSYAVRNAEVAVLSESYLVIAAVADLFFRLGKAQALKVMWDWCKSAVKLSGVNLALLNQLFALYPRVLPQVQVVTARNMEALVKESSEFRKKVRGVAIGGLG